MSYLEGPTSTKCLENTFHVDEELSIFDEIFPSSASVKEATEQLISDTQEITQLSSQLKAQLSDTPSYLTGRYKNIVEETLGGKQESSRLKEEIQSVLNNCSEIRKCTVKKEYLADASKTVLDSRLAML